MKRFIITGAPGSGKTSVIRQLELEGFSVVEEAATDVIAAAQAEGISEPWEDPSFIDAIARLQKERETRSSGPQLDVQFFDRSSVCTAALARYLGYPLSPFLNAELERIQRESVYEKQVFFVRNLGFITPTDARRISFEDSLRFETIHQQTYESFGFELVYIEPGSVTQRVLAIKAVLRSTRSSAPAPVARSGAMDRIKAESKGDPS